jgi:hypothetical protein
LRGSCGSGGAQRDGEGDLPAMREAIHALAGETVLLGAMQKKSSERPFQASEYE